MNQTISTDIVADVVTPLCESCFEDVAVEGGFGCCADCADFNFGSDRFKEEYGFRPRHSREAVIAWVRGETNSPWGF